MLSVPLFLTFFIENLEINIMAFQVINNKGKIISSNR